ncbi:MAG: holo-ACP synthase [Anaerolineae bacterium]|jgi:holo-[acyl-carrier protein] synthase|nr:holo-ACP synthase [Anaerolineae bacterium]MBT3712873.1 holo-ACP synthase [Anaerolineae bacterium]MBT4312139.1 holo-ACP synthase [Anaerolineae bacterium]MBT4459985.1 holo-ACP synthase [Anaerolineae bacterium]MBT4842766.1 holo-ACP synthase [Anaerolineae bacterium]
MNLTTGIDLIEIERIASAVQRHGERFLNRIFTKREIEDCAGRAESLAARFAAKEAAAKALGVGFGKEIAWDEIEIQRGKEGAPKLIFYRKAAHLAEKQNFIAWSVSLSHSQSHAIAMVVGIG